MLKHIVNLGNTGAIRVVPNLRLRSPLGPPYKPNRVEERHLAWLIRYLMIQKEKGWNKDPAHTNLLISSPTMHFTNPKCILTNQRLH